MASSRLPWIARSPGLATASVLGTTANGKLRNDHPYISAVAIVSQRDRAIDFYDDLVAGMDG